MVYAQIKNNVIVNVIVLDDPTLVSIFTDGFDYCVRIDNLTPVPIIGDTYNPSNGTFTSGS